MIGPILPLLIGFGIDCVLGDPHSLPHPVVQRAGVRPAENIRQNAAR